LAIDEPCDCRPRAAALREALTFPSTAGVLEETGVHAAAVADRRRAIIHGALDSDASHEDVTPAEAKSSWGEQAGLSSAEAEERRVAERARKGAQRARLHAAEWLKKAEDRER
jgi:hypothetical protein